MVHQLSLYGTIDDASYDLFISTMTTLSGTLPVIFANMSNVWKTNESYEFERVNTKNQLTELNRIKLSKNLPLRFLRENDQTVLSHSLLKRIAKSNTPIEPSDISHFLQEVKYLSKVPDEESDSKMDVDPSQIPNDEDESWAMSMSDIPAAGKSRKVSMQTISESVILSTGGLNHSTSNFLKELGYVPDFQYITIGVKFYMENDLILNIEKVWDFQDNMSFQITKGGYIIKVYINVNRSTDIERINQAESALLALQKQLNGYVDLSIPDRRVMDSRLSNMSDIL